jgi:hypothetical protein
MVAKLVGHNADRFDGPRLQRLFKQYNAFLPADPRCRCTCQRAMWWFDEHALIPPKGFSGEQHDALVDVRLTIQLARKMREATKAEEVVNVSAA